MFHPIAVHFKGSGFYNTDYGKQKRGGAELVVVRRGLFLFEQLLGLRARLPPTNGSKPAEKKSSEKSAPAKSAD